MYAPANVKRQKTTRDAPVRPAESTENFQGMGRVEYKPDTAYNTEDQLYYRYYNASERIQGKPFEDWLRPSIFLGQGFTPYPGCVQRPWSDNSQSVDNYKKSIRAMFELCIKIGVKFWTAYDKDIAPEGETFEETQTNFDQVVEIINEYQQKTGIRPLWIGVDFKNSPRYWNGAATNPDASVVAYAGFQVKRALDIAQKLNAEGFLFSGDQEGYENIINSDLSKEIKHYGRFLKLIIDQRDRIGFRGQLLMQTTNKIQKDFKYCNNLSNTLALLKHFNYDRHFKLNVGFGHDIYLSNVFGCLGSIDIKEPLKNISDVTLMFRTIIENGGIASGGLNFYLPNHKGSFEPKDLAEVFVTTIDYFAKALKLAIKLINDVNINKSIQMRYISFSSGWGAKFLTSDAALEECEEHVKKNIECGNVQSNSRIDHWTSVLSRYLDAPLK